MPGRPLRTRPAAAATTAATTLLLVLSAAWEGGRVAAHGLGPRRALIAGFNPQGLTWALDPAIKVEATPTLLQASGDEVSVCVAGVPDPRPDEDLIAAYAPATASLNETAPIKFRFLNESGPGGAKRYEATGQGCVRFRLLNLRDDYAFALFRGGMAAPTLAAVSAQPVAFAQPNEVTQVHLALTGQPQEVRVTWVTRVTQAPVVQWWEEAPPHAGQNRAAKLTETMMIRRRRRLAPEVREAAATSTTYTRGDLCGAPATTIGFHDPGQIHSAVMTGIEPGKSYAYRVGDKVLGVWGPQTAFPAPPFAPASNREEEDQTHTFAVFGDMGTAEEDGSLDPGLEEVASLNTTKLLLRALEAPRPGQPPLSLVVHVGDLSYAKGYDYQWDEFFHQIQPVAKAVPWMAGLGNHERDATATTPFNGDVPSLYRDNDSGGECGIPTQLRFPMPGPWLDARQDQGWYSFEAGPVHWVMLNFEKEFGPGSPQYQFLEDDLAHNVDRSRTPWVVVLGHRPMYVLSTWDEKDDPMSDSDQTVARLLQANLEELLVKAQVDLGLYGHHHSYQRTCQVVRGQCVAASGSAEYKGMVHGVVGMAGQGLSHNLPDAVPAIFEKADDQHFGLSLMTVNRTHLTITLYNDDDGAVLDTYTLQAKDHAAPSSSSPSSPSSSKIAPPATAASAASGTGGIHGPTATAAAGGAAALALALAGAAAIVARRRRRRGTQQAAAGEEQPEGRTAAAGEHI